MISPAVVPVWTPRRRLIAVFLALAWLIIGGLFLAALLDTQSTAATYGDDTAFVTLTADKSLALAFLQCVHFTWDAENVTLYKTSDPSFLPEIQPASGERVACSSEDARVVGEFNKGELKNVYPQTTWINPAALLYIGIAAIVGAIILWRPQWLGTYRPTSGHLIFVPFVISVALMTQVINPLQLSLTLVPVFIALIPISVLGFVLAYVLRGVSGRLFMAACALMVAATIGLSAYHLFTVPGMLNHDERFYASTAATGASGFGLYPYIQDYPPMPIMGGVGHIAWLYAGAYKLFGPTIWGPRLVTWLFYLLALPAIFMLFRRWYGTATAWLAIALIPATYFYTFSHSARLDCMTLAMLWWGLLIVDTARRKQDWRWHLAAGLFMGLGLQAHIHTSITTIACGILYLVDYVGEARQARRLILPRAVIAYSIGALMGLGIFVVANVLPNPDAFLRTAGNAARLSVVTVEKNLSLPERVLRSFLALESFIQITIQRIVYLFQYIPFVGLALGITSFITLVIRRRSPADRTALILFAGVLFAGFFILNGPSLYYTLHLYPVAVICLPAFFTHGHLRRGPVLISWQDVTPILTLVLLGLVFPIYLAFPIISPTSVIYDDEEIPHYRTEIDYVKANVSHECIVLGPGALYQNTFMAYPRYNTYSSEAGLGMSYYGFTKPEQLWPLLNPDIIFGPLDTIFAETLRAYIAENHYQEVQPYVWLKTHEPLTPGCAIVGYEGPK